MPLRVSRRGVGRGPYPRGLVQRSAWSPQAADVAGADGLAGAAGAVVPCAGAVAFAGVAAVAQDGQVVGVV